MANGQCAACQIAFGILGTWCEGVRTAREGSHGTTATSRTRAAATTPGPAESTHRSQPVPRAARRHRAFARHPERVRRVDGHVALVARRPDGHRGWTLVLLQLDLLIGPLRN